MNMEEYFRALETYVASRKLNLGDGGAVLSLLYEAYGDVNRIYDDQIKADFAELYQALNGMPLQEMDWIIDPVCPLRRDHGRNGFVYGVQIGIYEIEVCHKKHRLSVGTEASNLVDPEETDIILGKL